jgi:carbonic anhydrase
MIRTLAVIVCGVLFVGYAGAWADEPKSAVTPKEALQKLKDGHARFLAGKATPQVVDAKKRAELAKGQSPFAVVLACADSRVPPELLFDQGLGQLFVVRVAGNVTGPSILGSIEYAVEHLHTPLIVVLGHESCGAVKAALSEDDPDGNLGFLLREVHVGKHLPMDKKEVVPAAIKSNVLFHAAEITKRSSILKDFVTSGRVQVEAGVFSLTTGDVEWLTPAKKKATPAEKR